MDFYWFKELMGLLVCIFSGIFALLIIAPLTWIVVISLLLSGNMFAIVASWVIVIGSVMLVVISFAFPWLVYHMSPVKKKVDSKLKALPNRPTPLMGDEGYSVRNRNGRISAEHAEIIENLRSDAEEDNARFAIMHRDRTFMRAEMADKDSKVQELKDRLLKKSQIIKGLESQLDCQKEQIANLQEQLARKIRAVALATPLTKKAAVKGTTP